MKNFFKWISFLFVLIIVFIFILTYIFNSSVNKTWIERKLGNILNHEIKISKIEKNIFSTVFGIALFNIEVIIDKKSGDSENDKKNIISVKKAVLFPNPFKILFNRFNIEKIVLDNVEIVLRSDKNWHTPVITDFIYSNFYNKDYKNEDIKTGKSEFIPLGINEFNLPLNLKNIIIKDGNIKIINDSLKENIFIEEINGQIYDIALDPDDLFLQNQIKIKLKSKIKVLSQESIYAFLNSEISGKIIPFNNFDRLFDPMMQLEFKSGNGFIEKAISLKEVRSVPDIKNYCNGLEFFDDKLSWNDFFVKIWLNRSGGSFKEGVIVNNKYRINYAGKYENSSDIMDVAVVLLLQSEYNLKLAEILNENIIKSLKFKIKDHNELNQISTLFIKKIKNKSNNIRLQYSIKGHIARPKTLLAIPGIKSFGNELNKIINSRHSHGR